MHARRRSSFRLTGCIRQVARRGGRPAVLFVDTRASSGETRGAMLQLFHSRGDLVCPSVDRRPRTPRTAQQRTEQRAAEVYALRGPRSLSDRRTTDDLRCCAKGGIVDMSVYSNDRRPPATPSLLTQHDRSRIEGRIAAGQYLHASHLASEWALSQELAQRLFQ